MRGYLAEFGVTKRRRRKKGRPASPAVFLLFRWFRGLSLRTLDKT
jgi:hypothetical protein